MTVHAISSVRQDRCVATSKYSGRLEAVRIGKQYRIAQPSLEAFLGRSAAPADAVRRERHVEVSSIVQADAVSPEQAGRMTNGIHAAANSRGHASDRLRIDTIYDEERGRLKIILTGSVPTTAALLQLVALYLELS